MENLFQIEFYRLISLRMFFKGLIIDSDMFSVGKKQTLHFSNEFNSFFIIMIDMEPDHN
jgi:hypothetical protein